MTFDLEKAQTRREYLEKYYKDKENGYHPECEPLCVSEAADMLPAALDEIERQNASLDDAEALIRKNAETMNAQSKRIAELRSLNEDLMKNGNSLRTRAQRSETRRMELEEERNDLREKNGKQRAALRILGKRSAKRGKVLVEERAKIVFHNQMMPLMGINNWGTVPDDDFEIKVGNGMLPVKGKKYWMSKARKQLEAECEAMR